MTYSRRKINEMVLVAAMVFCGSLAIAPASAVAAPTNGSAAIVTPMACHTKTVEVCDYWFGIPVHCHTVRVSDCIS